MTNRTNSDSPTRKPDYYYGNYPVWGKDETPSEIGKPPRAWESWLCGLIFIGGILLLVYLGATS